MTHPRPDRRALRVLHLSDPHMTASGHDGDGVDTVRALQLLLATLEEVDGIDLVITTGDLADDASVDGCRRVLDGVGAFARERGVPHVYTTGNHDGRPAFQQVFGTGHLAPDGTDQGIPSALGDCCAAVSDLHGLRVVTLDSLVPGAAHGELDRAQLEWLRKVLRTSASRGTLVALHHPPLLLGRHPLRHMVLREMSRLAGVLAGSDARVILCGHLHHQMSGSLAGIPVHVAPGVVTQIDLTAPAHEIRGVLGAGAAVVDLDPVGPPVTYAVRAHDPRTGELVYRYDRTTGRRLWPVDKVEAAVIDGGQASARA